MEKTILFVMMVFSSLMYAQEIDGTGKQKELDEDLKYELAHKSQPWFSGMKDGANYFDIKAQFDRYFGQHQWEKSKPRALGENWLKSKIFYLDKNGKVQAEPVWFGDAKSNVALNYAAVNTWEMLGPVNSATTGYSAQGNHGGYVYLNRIDPTDNQKMFVSFVTGGLWMTSDGGTNWSLVDSNMPDEKYLDIDVAVSNPQVVYAISASQVIKSTDGGNTWSSTTLTNGSYSGSGYDIAVSTSNSSIVVARWGDKIYRTTDGGSTWSLAITGLPNHTIWDSSVHSEMLDWSTTNSNVVYSVSTGHNNQVSVHRSADAGATFSQINTISLAPNANGQIVGWAKLLLPSSNASSIYVAVGSGDNAYAHSAVHLYKLNATTGVQESVKVNMIAGGGDPYNHDPALHHGDIAMDRNDENKIVYGSYGYQKIYVSSNNGSTFSLSTAKTHHDIRSVDVVNNKIMVGSDGESILSTDNGATMPTLTNSISNHELWGFGSAFKTDLVAAGTNHGPVMIKESGNGFDWYNGTGADQGNTDVNPLDDRYVYSQGYSNYRYFRTGVHTLINESNFLDLGGIYSYFNSMEFHPNNYYTIITHHAGQYPTGDPNLSTWKNSLIKTEDNGNSISIVKTFNSQVFREKISMKNPNHIYVVAGLTNNKLWHTSDGGTTWTDITPSTTDSSGQTNISDIAVSDENPNEIWVTYSGVQTLCKVLKSSNAGTSWTNLTQANLTSYPVTKIIFQRGSDGGVYIGNKSGVYYRNNTMSNWTQIGTGLPMCEVRFMFINYNQGKLKIGTSRGAFLHDLYEISSTNALISADRTKITCPDTEPVQFKDYSVVRNSSATWSWSFPGGTPATSTDENPIVSYANATDGKYDVSLTVTDAHGSSTQTLTDFIEIVKSGQCLDPVISQSGWTLKSVDSEETTAENGAATNAFDGDNSTIWHTQYSGSSPSHPHEIQINLGDSYNITGLKYLPRQSGSNGTIAGYEIYVSADGTNWGTAVATGTWANNTSEKTVTFTSKTGSFIRLVATSEINGNVWTTAAEINVLGTEASECNPSTISPYLQVNSGAWQAISNATLDVGDNLKFGPQPTTGGTWSWSGPNGFSSTLREAEINNIQANQAGTYVATFTNTCGSASTHSFVITVTGPPPTYCAANGNDTSDEYIGRVQLGSIDNITTDSTGGYGDFTALSTSMSQGSSNTITITPTWTGNKYREAYAVWIDYNADGDFTDSGEQVWTKSASRTTPVSGSFTVPAGATLGATRMRVILRYKTIPSSCGSFDYGEVEDYTVNITGSSSKGTNAKTHNALLEGLNEVDIQQSEKPIIFPNPIKSNKQLIVKLSAKWINSTMILYGISGKKLTETYLNKSANNVLLNLPSGTYFVRIYNQKNNYSQKIIIE
ncbi:discoidin domain-containing protein [Snuella sedimenti]|uniref:Discoidin domain-containing protein n=1 Tax=Snuella sedimenti TaxID=2798802 RepID=A0A8J7IFB9_9FLAO|nr:discoidin domain-containing protein [Snuella sedimenti]MBJ6366663.1 discoidin domain-containing protein [Snuella sedimenti]